MPSLDGEGIALLSRKKRLLASHPALTADDIGKLIAKAQELADLVTEKQEWLTRVREQMKGWSEKAPRLQEARTKIENAMREIRQVTARIEDLELLQEALLENHLRSTGPVTIEQEDGSLRCVAAAQVFGQPGTLLPKDLLAVWRVKECYDGTILLPTQHSRSKMPSTSSSASSKRKTKLHGLPTNEDAGGSALLSGM